MRLEERVRGYLADAGFSVVDELDLTPWRPSDPSGREEGTLRWTVSDEGGRRGFVVLVAESETPVEVARPSGASRISVDHLPLVVGHREGVGGTSLVRLRVEPAEPVRFRRLLEAGVDPRSFVASADVVDLYERLGEGRLDLASAVVAAGGDAGLTSTVYRPESAEPGEYERLLAVLRLLDDEAPLRRVSTGPG